MNYPTIEELLDAGVHFGHLSSRWNPKMKPFIFTTRNRVHIINLEKTLEELKGVLDYIRGLAKTGGTILFVGTKRQAKDEVKKAAESCGMPFVTIRWLGGTFTNFRTIQKTIKKLESLNKLRASEDFEQKYTKKERLLVEREVVKLDNLFSGIKTMRKIPDAIFVVDVNHDKNAVKEARAAKVKVIGMADTNVDPGQIDHLIPANDDAIKSIALIVSLVAQAVNEGRGEMAAPAPVPEKEGAKA